MDNLYQLVYQADVALFLKLNSLVFQNSGLDWFIAFSAKYLDDWMLAGLLVFVGLPFVRKFSHLLAKNWEMVGLGIFAGLIARFGLTELIRFIYDRPRPFEIITDIHQLVFRDGGSAFPSGHATFYFALAAAISRYYPKTSLLFFSAATLQALGRVTAGLHWPSDVVAGMIIGIAAGLLIHWTYKKFF